jgi:hypothetical protein
MGPSATGVGDEWERVVSGFLTVKEGQSKIGQRRFLVPVELA